MTNISKIYLLFLMLFVSIQLKAQVDSLAFDIVDKAIGFIYNEGAGAIYYESIAQNVENPMDIFDLPLYQVDKGGHWFMDGDQFEIKTAGTIALCDGELLSIIDQEMQMMYVDSVREEPLIKLEGQEMTQEEMIDNVFGEGHMRYEGEEEVNGIPCHKVKANLEKLDGEYVFYWVSKDTNRLLLMAEQSEELYTVYLVKEVKAPPKNHNYKLVLPDEEITDFYGLQVIDMRFANQFLSQGG